MKSLQFQITLASGMIAHSLALVLVLVLSTTAEARCRGGGRCGIPRMGMSCSGGSCRFSNPSGCANGQCGVSSVRSCSNGQCGISGGCANGQCGVSSGLCAGGQCGVSAGCSGGTCGVSGGSCGPNGCGLSHSVQVPSFGIQSPTGGEHALLSVVQQNLRLQENCNLSWRNLVASLCLTDGVNQMPVLFNQLTGQLLVGTASGITEPLAPEHALPLLARYRAAALNSGAHQDVRFIVDKNPVQLEQPTLVQPTGTDPLNQDPQPVEEPSPSQGVQEQQPTVQPQATTPVQTAGATYDASSFGRYGGLNADQQAFLDKRLSGEARPALVFLTAQGCGPCVLKWSSLTQGTAQSNEAERIRQLNEHGLPATADIYILDLHRYDSAGIQNALAGGPASLTPFEQRVVNAVREKGKSSLSVPLTITPLRRR